MIATGATSTSSGTESGSLPQDGEHLDLPAAHIGPVHWSDRHGAPSEDGTWDGEVEWSDPAGHQGVHVVHLTEGTDWEHDVPQVQWLVELDGPWTEEVHGTTVVGQSITAESAMTAAVSAITTLCQDPTAVPVRSHAA